MLSIGLLALALSTPALAGPETVALHKCIADSTSGKDRKQLARWLFSAMAVHPEMRDISAASAATRETVSRDAGAIVTRLLSENCARKAAAARNADGAESIGSAFEYLGRLAMMELMSNPDVRATIASFDRFVDRRKVESAIGTK